MSTPEPVCGGWEAANALKQALGARIGYLVIPRRPRIDGSVETEVHVWRDPKPGAPCLCGKERWD